MKTIRLLGKGNLTPALRIVAWAMRMVVGATFIFSGFSKAVDPYGTFYKLTDYAAVVGWEIPYGVMLLGAFLLFCAEFVIGVMLVCGCFRRTTAICVSLVMLFMLPLSLWLAIANPVADCGCFGDAMVISNWATFWKNVGLMAACVWLLFFNRRIHWLITPALQWVALTLAIAYPVYLGFIGYWQQPVIDFRPFKAGTALNSSAEEDNVAGSVVKLIYRDAAGNEKAFNLDSIPDESNGWTFVRQEEQVIDAGIAIDTGKRTPEHGITIYSAFGDEEVTDDVLVSEGEQLILFMPRVSAVNVRDTWPINSLYRYSKEHNVDMMAVCAATPQEIAYWQDISLAEYPVYTAEDTSIKEVVRGNPALVYLQNGKIVWKQTLASTDVDALTAPSSQLKLKDLATDNRPALIHSSWFLVLALGLLTLFSFLPPAWRLTKRIRRRRRIAESAAKGK